MEVPRKNHTGLREVGFDELRWIPESPDARCPRIALSLYACRCRRDHSSEQRRYCAGAVLPGSMVGARNARGRP